MASTPGPKTFEITAADRTGLVAHGQVSYSRLLKLRGLSLSTFDEKTEPVPGSESESRTTHVITSAFAIADLLKKQAEQVDPRLTVSEELLEQAAWWTGYGEGADDSSLGAYKYTLQGVHEFAVARAAEGDKLGVAKWSGYGAGMEKRTGQNVPAGAELLIPIAAGRIISTEIAH